MNEDTASCAEGQWGECFFLVRVLASPVGVRKGNENGRYKPSYWIPHFCGIRAGRRREEVRVNSAFLRYDIKNERRIPSY